MQRVRRTPKNIGGASALPAPPLPRAMFIILSFDTIFVNIKLVVIELQTFLLERKMNHESYVAVSMNIIQILCAKEL